MNILIAELNTISFAHQSWIFGREVWRNPLWSLNPAKVCSLASSPLMPRAIQKGNAKYQTANVNNVLFPCKPWICWNIGFHAVFYMTIVNLTGRLSYFIEESWNVHKSLIQHVHLDATTSGNPQHVPPEALFGKRIINQLCVVKFIKNVRYEQGGLLCWKTGTSMLISFVESILYPFDHLLPDSNVQQWRNVFSRWNET